MGCPVFYSFWQVYKTYLLTIPSRLKEYLNKWKLSRKYTHGSEPSALEYALYTIQNDKINGLTPNHQMWDVKKGNEYMYMQW